VKIKTKLKLNKNFDQQDICPNGNVLGSVKQCALEFCECEKRAWEGRFQEK